MDDDYAARIGLVHFESPKTYWRDELRRDEIQFSVGRGGTWQATLAVSPNTTGVHAFATSRTGTAAWIEAAVNRPLAGRLSADAGIGYAWLERVGDRNYVYASAGLRYGIGRLSFYLAAVQTSRFPSRYWWDGEDRDPHSRTRWLASANWSF
jgi:hypothetical protein